MLKKKLQSLVAKNNLGAQNNFEIIHDQNAAQIIGGVLACPMLSTCGTYTGDCPNLTQCGTYSDSTPAA
ncbi:hypothetical protein [Mucilaginibacter sp. SJ]|uniref:hypothetical protein n=1 Tax=Mucilaginibacter sp. SJ TaxID=3029053 RepID=UPI0023AA093A|nr:hypothetical protein [Mucilaginibacter sp. SJ]WEA03862.1 hypothetical protein MusilaSJ_13050 [Mucilaginibacter sp. SJ]